MKKWLNAYLFLLKSFHHLGWHSFQYLLLLPMVITNEVSIVSGCWLTCVSFCVSMFCIFISFIFIIFIVFIIFFKSISCLKLVCCNYILCVLGCISTWDFGCLISSCWRLLIFSSSIFFFFFFSLLRLSSPGAWLSFSKGDNIFSTSGKRGV